MELEDKIAEMVAGAVVEDLTIEEATRRILHLFYDLTK